jgi:hypothetical protein
MRNISEKISKITFIFSYPVGIAWLSVIMAISTLEITLQGTTDIFTSDNVSEKLWIVICCVDELTVD